MNKIKVFLQSPWKFLDSPYYKYLIKTPPKEIEYLNIEDQKGAITQKRKFLLLNFGKKIIRKTLNFVGVSIPNTKQTNYAKKFDLIHCAHCLSLNKTPWVADFESWWQMWVSVNPKKIEKEKVKKILLDKNCKKIMPWTEGAKIDLIKLFPEIKKKLEVVYPAISKKEEKKRNNKDRVEILFVGRYFYEKGGLHALEAIDRLTTKYKQVYATFISITPKQILKKYSQNKKIRFLNLMNQSKLFKEIYPNADIFLYPGYSDTFGFTFLEAFSFGIPVVTMQGFARNEIIEEGKTGFIIDCPYWTSNELYKKCHRLNKEELDWIDKIIKKLSLLIENPSLRKKMSKNCRDVIKTGKFSIKERNKKLKKIYKEAIR